MVVYSCASITFPMIARYALSRAKPRPHRRLYKRIGEMVAELETVARGNKELQSQYPEFFGTA